MAVAKNWYVVNTYSSHENKVKDNLEKELNHTVFKTIFSV